VGAVVLLLAAQGGHAERLNNRSVMLRDDVRGAAR